MMALYLLQFALVAGALGTTAFAAPEALGRLSPLVRVGLAVSVTPIVLSLLTLALAALWPSGPRLLFQAAPAVLASSLIALQVRRSLTPLQLRKPRGLEWLTPAIVAIALLTAFVAGIRSAVPAATAHDVLIYLTEARVFALDPSLTSIPTFEAAPGEVVKSHPHQFLFQAFIAQALMFADGPIGHPNDLAARVAIQLTLPLLMLGLLALVRSVIPTWTAALALPLLLLFEFDYVVTAASVDSFRIAPFLVLVGLLLACLRRTSMPPWSMFVMIGAMAGVACAAHSLNIPFLLILGVGALIECLRSSRWPVAVRLALWSAPFVFAGILDNILNWLNYGHPLGRGMYYFFYPGTPLNAVFAAEGAWLRNVDPLSAFFGFSGLAGIGLMSAAVGAAAVVLVRASQGWARRVRPLAGIFLLCVWLPLMPGLGLQGAMVSNQRYGLIAAALSCVVMAVATAGLIRWTSRAASAADRRYAAVAAVYAGVLVVSLLAWWGAWNIDFLAQGPAAQRLGAVLAPLLPSVNPMRLVQAVLICCCAVGMAGVAGVVLLAWRLWKGPQGRARGAKALMVATAAGLPGLMSMGAALLWTYPDRSALSKEGHAELVRLADALPPGSIWVVDDYGIAYYARRPPLFTYSAHGAPLLQADTVAAARTELLSRDVRLVALRDARSQWWPSTPFHTALTRWPDARRRVVGVWTVYELPPAAVGPPEPSAGDGDTPLRGR